MFDHDYGKYLLYKKNMSSQKYGNEEEDKKMGGNRIIYVIFSYVISICWFMT